MGERVTIAETGQVYEVTQGIGHHPVEVCMAMDAPSVGCPFHRPSLHPMIEEPMLLRETGLIERICPHGVGHPDPDSVAYWNQQTGQSAWGVHGCDGCCSFTGPTRIS